MIFIFIIVVDLPFLQSEESDIIREKIIELSEDKLANVFPISAKIGSGLDTLTDKIRDIIERLRENSNSLEKETD